MSSTITAEAMLEDVKLALRIKTDAFNAEITRLINSGLLDLGVAGVEIPEGDTETETPEPDPIVSTAVITYCRLHFGQPDDYDRLKRSYDEQKAQLATCTGYTDWLNGE